MKLSDFDYQFPRELIAQKPIRPRDHSRLMVLNRQTKKIEHRYFYDIVNYLHKGDVLVMNDTKVFPARLIGHRQGTGGKVEVFLLKNSKFQVPRNKQIPNSKFQISNRGEIWQVLIGNRRKKIGQIIEFCRGLKCEIIRQVDESVWEVMFNKSGRTLEKLIDEVGQVPTPPYIKSRFAIRDSRNLKQQYQTVYAKYRGSVAAPTAGFHFTKSLINKLKKKGVQMGYVTLHVGFGTFEPVKVNDITKHKMHSEFAILDKETAARLNRAKQEGRRIIAVGTTTVRTLETFLQKIQAPSSKKQTSNKQQVTKFRLKAQQKWTDIFIYPNYQFKFVDAMITNFHLPKSTLLMLVMAFAGQKLIKRVYQIAIRKKYRFYSFGDAMFID